MAQIRQTLKLESDPTTEVFPNVQPENIPASAIDETKIASNAVTESKINAGAVTNTKLANNAITTPKIADNAVKRSKISRTDNYVIDDEYGEDIDAFVTYFTDLFKSGFRFYYDDENGEICSVDGIEIQNHSVTLFVSYPFQGMNQIQQIDSTNFSTYFQNGDYGTMLHYCGA